MGSEKIYITGLRITHYAGLSAFELEPGQITILAGPNGVGKTSVINSIVDALARGGIPDNAVRVGEDKAEVIVDLSSGVTVKRRKSRGKSGTLVVSDENSKLNSPQSVLNDLLDPVQLDPVAWISGDRTAALLDSMPLRVTAGQLHELYKAADIPASQRTIPNDLDRHALIVLAEATDGLSKQLTEVNAEVKQLSGWVDSERQALTDAEDPAPEIDRLQEERTAIASALAEGRAAAEQIAMADLSVRDASRDVGAKLDAIKAAEREVTAAEQALAGARKRLDAATTAHAEMQERLGQAESNVAKLRADHSNIDEAVAALEANDSEIAQRLDALKEKRGAWTKAQQQRGRIEGEAERLESLRVKATQIRSGLKAFRSAPADLLSKADLPIDGLAYEDGQLTLNGVPVARLSGAETVRLAVKIAHHRVRERQGKFVLLDGLEKLHDDQRAAMLDEIRGSDVQWLMTEVGLRGNGEGVEVVVMGPASKQDKPVKGGSAPSKQGALDV